MKFLHTGDLHLGQKLSSSFSKELKERLKEDEKTLFSNIINLANDKEIPYLFISGDMFDSNKPSFELVSFVVSEFEKYKGRVFITPGNHDYNSADSVYSNTEFPPNVHIFGEEISLVETDDCLIYGYGFIASHKNEDSFRNFKVADTDKPSVMLIHTDFNTNSFYNPVNLSDIEASGISYVAAAHIHIREDGIRRGKTYINYCGAPRNLNFKEAGESQVITGELSKDFLQITKVDVSCHRYLNLIADVSDAVSSDDVLRICSDAVMQNNPENALINLKITGSLKDEIQADFDLIKEKLSSVCLYIRIEEAFVKKYDIRLLLEENSVRGEFVRQVLSACSSENEEFINKVIEKGMKYL